MEDEGKPLLYPKDSITLGEGRDNAFIVFLKKGGDCR